MLKPALSACLVLLGILYGCSDERPVRPGSQKIRTDHADALRSANLAELEDLSPDKILSDHNGEGDGTASQCMTNSLQITQGKLVAENSVMLRSTVKIKFRSNVYCTGTLVGPRHVLTAAHCLKGETPTEVRFGREPDASPEYIAGVKWWINHPDFGQNYDLAVVLLQNDVPAKYSFAKIANPKTLRPGMKIYFAGYGSPSETNKSYTNPLAWTAVNLESINTETKTFSTVIDGRGSCYGDSGGPGYIMDSSQACLLTVGVVNTASLKGNGLCGQGDTSFDATQATGWIGDSFKILGAPLPYPLPLDGTESAVSRNILGAPLPE